MKKGFLLFAIFSVLCKNAHADSTGTVLRVVCHAGNVSPLCQVSLNGSPNLAACATSSWHYTFDGSTSEGKNLLSIILAAQVSRQTISIGGKGTCALSNGSEDLRHAYMVTAP
ncbi:hypothetical protein [Pseudomonas sp. AA-38]|uniref:hypothetical protein n=1 Tax=Pseudomonas sp. AA-38 TaxID=3028807 RepID=UPI0023F98A8F|nr:hypothetical protein [Pseudomonas sp. AA-38]